MARVQEQVVLGDLEHAPDAGAVNNEVGGTSTSLLRRTGTGHRWKSVRVLVVHDGAGKEEEVWCCL
jgi:hypothetical protein